VKNGKSAEVGVPLCKFDTVVGTMFKMIICVLERELSRWFIASEINIDRGLSILGCRMHPRYFGRGLNVCYVGSNKLLDLAVIASDHDSGYNLCRRK